MTSFSRRSMNNPLLSYSLHNSGYRLLGWRCHNSTPTNSRHTHSMPNHTDNHYIHYTNHYSPSPTPIHIRRYACPIRMRCHGSKTSTSTDNLPQPASRRHHSRVQRITTIRLSIAVTSLRIRNSTTPAGRITINTINTSSQCNKWTPTGSNTIITRSPAPPHRFPSYWHPPSPHSATTPSAAISPPCRLDIIKILIEVKLERKRYC